MEYSLAQLSEAGALADEQDSHAPGQHLARRDTVRSVHKSRVFLLHDVDSSLGQSRFSYAYRHKHDL